jgi:hypothetical protein
MREAKNIKVELVGRFLRIGTSTLVNPAHIIKVQARTTSIGESRLDVITIGGKSTIYTTWDFGVKTDDEVLVSRFRDEANECMEKICSALEMLSMMQCASEVLCDSGRQSDES